MKVKLIAYNLEAEKVVASAAKLCYSAVGIDEIQEGLTEEKTEGFINMLMDIGHESPIEHVSFTFAIEGVSRVLTHQLVRHRIASYSQQSQRYVKLEQFEYIIPPEIETSVKATEIFKKQMKESQKSYDELVEILSKKHLDLFDGDKRKATKKAIEDARFVFPNACETKIVVTMNARSLMNFFKHRCCNRAQWEIRDLATEMLKLVKEKSSILFKNAGPSCISGPCPEGKMTCGDIENVRKKFKKL